MSRLTPIDAGDQVRWNGWGYADTKFELNKKGQVQLSGTRYLFSGKVFPDMRTWVEDVVGINIDNETPSQVSLLATI